MPYLLLLKAHWKLAALGLLLLCIAVQTVRLERSERRADRVTFQLNEAREALREADRKSREAKKETDRRIEALRKRLGEADGLAERVENAPLPGNCRTPESIRSLDI